MEGARAKTPELIEEQDDTEHELPSTPDHESQCRQKLVAALKPMGQSAVLARLLGPMTNTSAAFIADIRSHYAVCLKENRHQGLFQQQSKEKG